MEFTYNTSWATICWPGPVQMNLQCSPDSALRPHLHAGYMYLHGIQNNDKTVTDRDRLKDF
jgi:hypothetical protein